ncbi:BON domain-containing protein [Oceanispirochaeta crateris]|nr:BON domain-containing protein [Oceanispirochaeta crateris]
MASKMDTLKNKIMDAIKADASNIVTTGMLVSVVKKGSFFASTMEVQLSGRVDLKGDVEKIGKIATEVAGGTPVVNSLRFKA